MEHGACAVFLAAHDVGLLFAARALQGLAVGTATGALGAALLDLQPQGSGLAPLITIAAPLLGLGAGALGSSALDQYGPAPARLCGGCCSAPASPPPPGYWRYPSPAPGALASWPRSGPGWACRAMLIAAIFTISFLGLSIPALIAGVATAHFGLHRTALAYCVAIAALAAMAAGSLILRRGARPLVHSTCQVGRGGPPEARAAVPGYAPPKPSAGRDIVCGRGIPASLSSGQQLQVPRSPLSWPAEAAKSDARPSFPVARPPVPSPFQGAPRATAHRQEEPA